VYKVPIFIEPKMVPRVWGGKRLAEEFGRQLPDEPVGESWEIHGDLTVVGTDRTLDQLVAERGQELLGSKVSDAAGFPLLTKWLDCRAWLSVQVHPDDKLAQEFTGDSKARGKTEAWYVHSASDDAELIHGLAQDAKASQLEVAEGEAILPLLSRFKPTRGQLLFTPAGQVHALGPGNFIYEVQQSCDLTYRFYDWGRDREIHPKKAAECVKRSTPTPATFSTNSLECEYFRMEIVHGPSEWDVSADSFQIVAMIADSTLTREGDVQSLKAGQSVLFPAGMGKVKMQGVFLRVSVP
jgi:mannose-6-phosphate isomerase